MIHTQTNSGKHYVGLQGAILLYGADAQHHSHATVHGMNQSGGRPQIGVGRPITESDLSLIYSGLSESRAPQPNIWLDSNILAKSTDRMVWWTPAQTRPMFFKKSDRVAGTFTASGVCPVPAMVWMAIQGRGLYVFATKEASRPTQETVLHQAPFFNVWGRGLVCSGNAVLPAGNAAWEAKAWEQYFFGSKFTHPNFNVKDRLVLGVKATSFWKKMVEKPTAAFPEECLVELPLKAGNLVDPLIVDRLNALPKPKGEF